MLIRAVARPVEYPIRRLVQTIRGYDAETGRADAIAGLTVAVVAVPQSMAYALIAEVPPQYGLYTVIIQSFIGSVFASHPLLSIGPINTHSLLVASIVTRLRHPGDAEAYLSFVIALTLLKGLIQIAMSVARLGNLARYVSASVIVGFTAGAGVLIAAGQVNHFLGFEVHRSASDWSGLVGVWQRLHSHLDQTSAASVALGLVALGVMAGSRLVSRLAPGPLLAVVATGCIVAVAGWSDGRGGFALIGRIELAWPRPAMPGLQLPIVELEALLSGALALSLLGLIEAYAVGRSLAVKTAARISANQELFGQGITNLVSSYFWCIPGSGSFSRSALNHFSGARTVFSGFFNALFVLAIFVGFGPLAGHVPMSCIAAILFIIAASLIDWRYLLRVVRSDRADTAVCVGTFVSTLFVPLAYAVFVGVFLNLALYLRRAGRLHIAEMVRAPDPEGAMFLERPVRDRTGGEPVIFLQVEGDLFFAVADELQDRLGALDHPDVRVVILRLKRTHLIDATVMTVIENFTRRIQARDAHLVLCGVRDHVLEQMRNFGLISVIGQANVFETGEGVFTSAKMALKRAQTIVDRSAAGTENQEQADYVI